MLHHSSFKYEFLAFMSILIIGLIVQTKFFSEMEREILSIAFGLSGFGMFFRPLWFLFHYPRMKKYGETVKAILDDNKFSYCNKGFHWHAVHGCL